MNDLKTKIEDLIKDDSYDMNDIVKIIDPAFSFIKDDLFAYNIRQVVGIITTDRNNDAKFTIKDLELLSKDPLAMTLLGTSFLLMVKAVPSLKAQFDKGALEELLFKISAYIFLVAIPKEIKHKWTQDEKTKIINIVMSIYMYIKTSDVTYKILGKIKVWFQTKGWRKLCLCAKKDAKSTVIEKMPEIHSQLEVAMKNIQDKANMQHQIVDLQAKLENK